MRVPAIMLLLVAALPLSAQLLSDQALLQSLKGSHQRASESRAVVWAPAAWTKEEHRNLAQLLDATIKRVENHLGTKVSGSIEYFVVDDETPSHVYGGYAHAATDPNVVFLSGLEKDEAPYIHETTHIVAGEFGSLLLREGLATHVQFAIDPGPMRPLVKLGEIRDRDSLDAAVRKALSDPQRAALAEEWIFNPKRTVSFTSRIERTLFYAVSASFVSHLVDEIGMAKLMKIYRGNDQKLALKQHTGRVWDNVAQRWLAALKE